MTEQIIQSPQPNLSKIFRSYDIRGLYPSEVNESVAERIGRAYADVTSGKEVKQIIVAHDVRAGSPQLALSFIKGASHAKTAFAGMLPLGTALFHACKTDAELVYITASHLPAEWNGMKFFHPTGAGWLEDENYALRDRFNALPVGPSSEKVSRHTVIDPDATAANYIRHILSKIQPKKRLRVVLDCGNGAASVVAPKLFALGGFDVKALWAQPDGRFPNRSPDPHGNPLGRLKEAVKSEHASLGIAYDGDGDRMSVVDDRGQTLSPERTAYFILSELLKTAKGPIIANIECTRTIDDIARVFDRNVIRVPVGHTFLMDAVHSNKAAFGLEVSGHYALPALVPFDDALAISYYMACVLARQEKQLSEIVSSMPEYPFERINFVCDDDRKFEIINTLKLKLTRQYPDVNDMDGLRIDFEDGWILIRASNTEPKIRLTVEANTPERLEQLKTEFSAVLQRELTRVYKPSFMAKLKSIFGKKQ